MSMVLNRNIVLATSALGLSLMLTVPAANAKIVAEGKLSQYCAEEAVIKLNVDRQNLLLLPVEKNQGKFHVYGQTDSGPLSTFECTFDSKKKFLGITVQGGHEHKAQAGAPKAGINKCLQMVGVPATVEKISPLKPGYSEIIIKEKSHSRRVACTVTDDGSSIEDWVEMN